MKNMRVLKKKLRLFFRFWSIFEEYEDFPRKLKFWNIKQLRNIKIFEEYEVFEEYQNF
jgi:hypothetical protein